jgi:transcriptional regulator with XRE-family HTH domain
MTGPIRLREPGDVMPTLRRLRRRRGWSLYALAGRAGKTKTQLDQWELGRVTPRIAAVFLIAHALGYDLALIPREDT